MSTAVRRRWAAKRGVLLGACVAITVQVTAAAASMPLTSEHLTTTATCALVSYPATSSYSFDSFVDQNNAGANSGTNNNLTLQSQPSKNRRVYIRFDLTSCLYAVPSGAIVRSATLRLSEAGALPAVCRTYDVFRNTSGPWTESGVTWTNQPAGTTVNQPPTAQRTSSQDVGTPTACANHTGTAYVAWDVKADVAAFLAGTATNYGWMLRDDTEDSGTTYKVNFSARDQANLALAPQLLVTYTLV